MSDGTPKHLRTGTAAEACRDAAPGDEARGLLRDGQTVRQYLDALIGAGHHPDAARVLAHALAKREAVWWACLCARAAAGPNPPPPVSAALQAAERWVVEPVEGHRRAAMAAAEAAGFGTPAGCAGAAAFWSGGSLGPPHVQEIPPGEHLTARGVAGAVMLAVVQMGPEKAPETYRTLLAWGLDVAEGTNRWQEAPAAVPPAEPGPAKAARVAPPRPARIPDTWE